VSIGDALAAARTQAGLSITQVSQRTCIRETIVRGIERGDYSACGGDFYARGHIRSIGRAVGLDPEELIREYDATQAPPQQITAADVFQPFTPVKLKERRRRPYWSGVLAAGVVVALAIVGFRFFGSHGPPARPTAATTHTTQTTHSSPPKKQTTTKPVVNITPRHVALMVVAKPGSVTWAEFTAANGRVVFQGDIGVGAGLTQKSWTAPRGPVTVQLGNPGGAILYLNGKRQAYNQTHPVVLSCTRTICTAH
jgi:cytoskeletal protein RodZ